MKKTRCFFLFTGIVLIAVLVVNPPCVNAENGVLKEPISIDLATSEKETLRGAKIFGVAVENLRPEAKRFGLTEDELKADVELKCKLAGITISSATTYYLYIKVKLGYLESEEHFIYNILVQFNQKVYLLRTSRLSCFATTWDKDIIGIIPAREMEQKVRSSLMGLVDKFINDYLEVNSKK
jgi:hypothetical protein